MDQFYDLDQSLKDKVIVVTGGAQGIGYQIIDKCLEKGAKTVIILDVNETQGEISGTNLNAKHGDGKAVFIKCDVTKDLEEISKTIFDKFKQVNVLVNNAGIVDETSPRRVMEVNAIAVIEWSMKFWEHMRTDKGGHGGTIINIGSVFAYSVDPYVIFYKSAKFAVMGFTRSLGHMDNYEKFGVRVVILCPGFTTTSMTGKSLCWTEHTTAYTQFLTKQRKQSAEDVGRAAVEVHRSARSGSAWKIDGGVLSEIPLIEEGEFVR